MSVMKKTKTKESKAVALLPMDISAAGAFSACGG